MTIQQAKDLEEAQRNQIGWGEKIATGINNVGGAINTGLTSAFLAPAANAVQGYRNLKPQISTLMNLLPHNQVKNAVGNFSDKFSNWQANDQDLYNTYMHPGNFPPLDIDDPDWLNKAYNAKLIPNARQYSSAFGEAKGANLVNAPFLGKSIFADSMSPTARGVDYGIGAAQLLAGNAINTGYQLGQEGYNTVKDQGWKGLISTDWIKDAMADVVEEGRGFVNARFTDKPTTTPSDLWTFADTVDDAVNDPTKESYAEKKARLERERLLAEATTRENARQAQAKAAEKARAQAVMNKQTEQRNILHKAESFTRPTTQSVSPVQKSRARATRGRTAPVMRQPSRQARNYFGGYQR